jgi:ubiquinone biosynthesis protein
LDFQTLSRLGRFKDIIMILLKYGFDEAVQRLELPGMQLIRKAVPEARAKGTYERIRTALEVLGPTFVKFGQIMSLRPDLVPPPLLLELSKLQDNVAPVPLEKIRTVLETELGVPLKEVFSIFDVEPLAAASISQVHRGVLKNEGHIVAIKIQRPGIRQKIDTDLNILNALAERLHERSEGYARYDLPNLVRVVRRNLMWELDFVREAHNMKIARSYGDGSGIYIPEVYESHSTKRLLVMEYVQGTKIRDAQLPVLEEREELAKMGLQAAIKQIFADGFFHADPHPGNLLITSQRGLCLLDWGIVGRVTEKDRFELIDLVKAVVEKDSDAMVHALLRICVGTGDMDVRALERDLLGILDAYHAVPIKDLNIGQLLLDVTALVREYRLRLPAELVVMVKALITAEGSARLIYPELDVFSQAREQVTTLAVGRFKPEVLWRALRTNLSSILSSQREIPRRLMQIIQKLESGELGIRFHIEKLEELFQTLENVSNRLSFAVIIAALIIGSSMIITTGFGPLLFGFSALGVIGYFISAVLGLWLVFNIIRTRRY